MTVKELKEILNTMQDDREIVAELNGRYYEVDGAHRTKSTNELLLYLKKQ